MSVKKYFLYFAQEFIEFRHAEIESIIKMNKINLKIAKDSFKKPYLIITGCEADVCKIAERSVLLRYIAEVWATGEEYRDFHENLKSYQISEKYISNEKTFKINVECFNKKIKLQQKIEKIETMNYLPFLGKINLVNADYEYIYFEYYGTSIQIPENPLAIVFGRKIMDGKRSLIKYISLKERKFIGNTSMNEQLSLLMANIAQCSKNDLVYDPFCGTGSLLIPPSLFKSFVIGSDIDYLVIHGKSKPTRVQQRVRDKDESVRANMEQYNLEKFFLGIFIADFSNCPLNDTIFFDAIVTDRKYYQKLFKQNSFIFTDSFFN
jgi:tRNA (guanine10-N2)-methyltransferase